MTKKQPENIAEKELGEVVEYNFPAFNVTVKARSTREAEEKLHEILKDK